MFTNITILATILLYIHLIYSYFDALFSIQTFKNSGPLWLRIAVTIFILFVMYWLAKFIIWANISFFSWLFG